MFGICDQKSGPICAGVDSIWSVVIECKRSYMENIFPYWVYGRVYGWVNIHFIKNECVAFSINISDQNYVALNHHTPTLKDTQPLYSMRTNIFYITSVALNHHTPNWVDSNSNGSRLLATNAKHLFWSEIFIENATHSFLIKWIFTQPYTRPYTQ